MKAAVQSAIVGETIIPHYMLTRLASTEDNRQELDRTKESNLVTSDSKVVHLFSQDRWPVKYNHLLQVMTRGTRQLHSSHHRKLRQKVPDDGTLVLGSTLPS